ncbi:MAG: DUF86 domain-containing protein [Anaerolineaceae bacterium]|nr:DUF86 domain-containing protein [Anaerolineaceae bacterium]
MQECMQRILDYTKDGRQQFMQSTLIQDAVLRNLQTMAESSQRLSIDLKEARPEIEWRRLSGFRNVLVHEYLGIDLKTVWQLVEDELPKLLQQIESMLSDLNEN